MRLDPLKPASSKAANIITLCCRCLVYTEWNIAAATGWCADLDGEPFHAYYCKACVSDMTQPPESQHPTK